MKTRIIGFIAIVAVLVLVLLGSQHRAEPLMVSGFVESDEIRLGSRVGGRVAKVHVEEGRIVKKSDVLIELEPYDLLEREAQYKASYDQARAEHDKLSRGFRDEDKAQAQARVDQLAAKVLKLKNGPRPQEIEAARADLQLAQATLDLAQDAFDRIKNLFEQKAASQDQYDRAAKDLRAGQALVTARSENLKLLEAGTRPEEVAEAEAQLEEARQAHALTLSGYRPEEVQAAYAALQSADAALRALREQLQELSIKSPLDGVVEAVELQPGDLVGANAPVISLLDPESLWVRAYVPEDKLYVKRGQTVKVTVDSFPDEEFSGEITFIARDAEFTPSNVQTPEERSKQVFRIKVTIRKGREKLRPGMAADVWLDESAENGD
jgi:multidrug resistance efflux pump